MISARKLKTFEKCAGPIAEEPSTTNTTSRGLQAAKENEKVSESKYKKERKKGNNNINNYKKKKKKKKKEEKKK